MPRVACTKSCRSDGCAIGSDTGPVGQPTANTESPLHSERPPAPARDKLHLALGLLRLHQPTKPQAPQVWPARGQAETHLGPAWCRVGPPAYPACVCGRPQEDGQAGHERPRRPIPGVALTESASLHVSNTDHLRLVAIRITRTLRHALRLSVQPMFAADSTLRPLEAISAFAHPPLDRSHVHHA